MTTNTNVTLAEWERFFRQKESALEHYLMVFKKDAFFPHKMSSGESTSWGEPYYYVMNCNHVYGFYVEHPDSPEPPPLPHVYRWSKEEYMLACLRGEIVNGRVERTWYQLKTRIIDLTCV